MPVLDGLTLIDSGDNPSGAGNGTNLSDNIGGTYWGDVYSWSSSGVTLQYWSNNIATSDSGGLGWSYWYGNPAYTLANDSISARYAINSGHPQYEPAFALMLRLDDPYGGSPNAYAALFMDVGFGWEVGFYYTYGQMETYNWSWINGNTFFASEGDRFTLRMDSTQEYAVYQNEDILLGGYDYAYTSAGYPGIAISDTYVGLDNIYYGDHYAAPSGTNYPKIISLSVSATPGLRRGSQKPLARSVTATPMVARRSSKPMARTVTATPTVTKTPRKTFSLTSVVTPAFSAGRGYVKSLAVNVLTTITQARRTNRSIGVNVTATPTDQVRVNKPLTRTVTTTVSDQARVNKTFNTTVNTTVGLAKRTARRLATTVIATFPGFQAIFDSGAGEVYQKVLDLTVTTSTSMSRRARKVISRPISVIPNIVRDSTKHLYVGDVTNYLGNPSAEFNLGGIANNGNPAAWVRDNTQSLFGNWSMRVDALASSDGIAWGFPNPQGTIFIEGIHTLTISAFVRGTPGQQARIVLSERTSSGGSIRDLLGQQIVLDGTWQRISQTVTTTGDQGGVRVKTLAVAAPQTFWVDGVMLSYGPTLHPYGDGDQPGWKWDGTPHQSPSSRIAIAPVLVENTTVEKRLDTAVATLLSFRRNTGKQLNVVQAVSPSLARAAARRFAVAITNTVSVRRGGRKTINAFVTHFVGYGPTKSNKNLDVPVATEPSLRRSTSRIFDITQSVVATIVSAMRGQRLPTQHRLRANMAKTVGRSGIAKRIMRSGLGNRRLR